MRDLLVDIVNHRSFFSFAVIILAIMTLAFVRDGIGIIEVLLLVGIVAGGFAVWRLRVTSPTREIDSLQAFQRALQNGSRPTLIQLYSRFCGGCLAIKPTVDQLEAEAGERLRIIRLDIDQEPGKSLLREYDVLFTPTFLYFDKDGNKLRESTLVLDRPRILYDLERA